MKWMKFTTGASIEEEHGSGHFLKSATEEEGLDYWLPSCYQGVVDMNELLIAGIGFWRAYLTVLAKNYNLNSISDIPD